jgi:hypothetical protein
MFWLQSARLAKVQGAPAKHQHLEEIENKKGGCADQGAN